MWACCMWLIRYSSWSFEKGVMPVVNVGQQQVNLSRGLCWPESEHHAVLLTGLTSSALFVFLLGIIPTGMFILCGTKVSPQHLCRLLVTFPCPYFFTVLGVKPRTLSMPNICFNTKLYPKPPISIATVLKGSAGSRMSVSSCFLSSLYTGDFQPNHNLPRGEVDRERRASP